MSQSPLEMFPRVRGFCLLGKPGSLKQMLPEVITLYRPPAVQALLTLGSKF